MDNHAGDFALLDLPPVDDAAGPAEGALLAWPNEIVQNQLQPEADNLFTDELNAHPWETRGSSAVDGSDPLAAFQDFSKYIPRYQKPSEACDYCRLRGLECFMIYGCNSCSSCNTLFRPCSFLEHGPTPSRGHFDTLHSVTEDVCQDTGRVTGTKPLFSYGATPSDMRPESRERKTVTRYPKAAVRALKDWFRSHSDHPYPTDDEKEALRVQTGLTATQVATWLANARRRRKARSQSLLHGSSANCSPIDIAADNTALTPFERWKNSPPEHEPASMSDITRAVARNDLKTEGTHTPQGANSSTGSLRSGWRPASTTSLDTTMTEDSHASSSLQSHGSRSSYNSFAKKDRRRRRRTAGHTVSEPHVQPRNYHCTFCCDTFRTKYDWSRHEKSLHLSLEKWMCAPLGPITTHVGEGHRQCVYCLEKNPSPEHIESHNHSTCEEKGKAAKTFYRKDHLRQHLRLVHNVAMHSGMDSWMSAASEIKSRCGFCKESFTTWQSRVDHLAKHFKEGIKMEQWKGDWGFEPHVQAMVTNCMPPFLIGMESKSQTPFSATNAASMRDHSNLPRTTTATVHTRLEPHQYPPGFMTNIDDGLPVDTRGSCWEILTVRLGDFVRELRNAGSPVTDSMLQRQSRLILYGEDDEWHQTAADNVEWLTLFKQSHGLTDRTTASPTTGTGEPSANTSDFGFPSAELPLTTQSMDNAPFFDFVGDSTMDGLIMNPSEQVPLPAGDFDNLTFDDFFLQDIDGPEGDFNTGQGGAPL